MGACEFNVAEQEWRESWEPILPLVAPDELTIKSGLPDDWTETERQLEYIVRLVGWLIHTRAAGVTVYVDDQLHEAIERVERLVVEATA